MFITKKTEVIDWIGLISLYLPQTGFYLCVLVPVRRLPPVYVCSCHLFIVPFSQSQQFSHHANVYFLSHLL